MIEEFKQDAVERMDKALDSLSVTLGRLRTGRAHPSLLEGITGSGKTFTMAQVIAAQNRPTLVMVHNKTLEINEVFY